MKITKHLTCFFILFFLVSCSDNISAQANKDTFVVATWNVQNLFDYQDDGTEYEEYTSGNGWKESFYRERLKNINKVLGYDRLKDADIIVLNEIENERVVEDILSLPNLRNNGFSYYVCAGEPGGAIKTSIISKYEMKNPRIHAFDGARPVIEVECDTDFARIFILGLHAKSHLGDENESRLLRFEQAASLEEIAERLLLDYPGCIVIAAGDFNESYYDENMMADMRFSKNTFCENPLKVLGDFDKNYWYCMWMDASKNLKSQGSYVYEDIWHCYDNILVKGTKVSDAGVIFEGILKSLDEKPAKWNRNLLSGVSDHLPIWVEIMKN